MLKLPIGIENYIHIQDYYCIDKTLLIRDIVEYNLHASVLVTRPRRFGKSLALSMVECFFDCEEDNRPYFEDKRIHREWKDYDKYVHSCPVIHASMKNITSPNVESFYAQISLEMSKHFIAHYDLFQGALTSFEMENVDALAKGTAPISLLMDSLYLLTAYLRKATNKEVVLLLDEYDTPIQTAFENGYYKEAIAFFKSFYTSALKGNENILLSLITGVVQIGKESLFSGLNNLKVYSILENRLSTYFGFTEDEVETMLRYYGLDVDMDKLRSSYGGYRFGQQEVFNPWSILNFVDNEGKFRFYWKNIGSNNLIYSFCKGHEYAVNELLMRLYNYGHAEASINASLSFADVNGGEDAMVSFLTAMGYLAVEKDLDEDRYLVAIPNRETRNIFQTEILNRYFQGNPSLLPIQLKEALSQGDVSSIKHIFEQYILSSFSYLDFSDWKNYQILTLGIVSALFDSSIVKSEVNGIEGRCDISISPKKEGDIGVIIEIKHSNTVLSKARLQGKSKAALTQIKQHHYYDELVQRKATPLLLYGFAFDKQHIDIQFERVQ